MKYTMGCLLLCMVAAVMLSGCAMTSAQGPMTPASGFLYSDVKGPFIAGEGAATKTGTSKCMSVLGLVALGDASLETAMKNGQIKKINHVDYHNFNILGIFAELTVTVYGE